MAAGAVPLLSPVCRARQPKYAANAPGSMVNSVNGTPTNRVTPIGGKSFESPPGYPSVSSSPSPTTNATTKATGMRATKIHAHLSNGLLRPAGMWRPLDTGDVVMASFFRPWFRDERTVRTGSLDQTMAVLSPPGTRGVGRWRRPTLRLFGGLPRGLAIGSLWVGLAVEDPREIRPLPRAGRDHDRRRWPPRRGRISLGS